MISEQISPEPAEPAALAVALTQFVARHEPGSRLHSIGTDLLRSHNQTRDRRAAVLKHTDLAQRLVDELGYAKPQQWNGYIPPAATDPAGDIRLCAAPMTGIRGDVRYKLNQLGRYAIGETPNDSPRREALLAISREAWVRERRDTVQAEPAPEGATDVAR